jgi:hypothetical protein
MASGARPTCGRRGGKVDPERRAGRKCPMAKRRSSTRTQIVRVPSAPRVSAPIIQVRAPAAPRHSKKRSSGKRRGSGKSRGGHGELVASAMGGAALGFIERQFPNLPTVPLLGRKGTIALIAHYFRGKFPMAREISIVAAGLAGYELARDGRISGEDHDYVVPQVRGIASQV